MSFNSLDLKSYLLDSIKDNRFDNPTPIQEQAIPAIIKGRDILGIAPTGSGKTAAYALPVIQLLDGKTETKSRHINALVLVPTRELAVQVEEVFKSLTHRLPFRIKSMAVHGGVSINPQMKNMQHVNILVATPGRLLELADSNAMHFDDLQVLVIDEADKMLNMGFKKEMDRVSATLSTDVQSIEKILLQDPHIIKIEKEEQAKILINQTAYLVELKKKGPLLRHLIKSNDWQQVLVFTSSVYQADLVANKLFKNGIQAKAIHSKKSQGSRQALLKEFMEGKLRVLVSTDLLSRGIDIAFLPHVVNYELPRSPKDFIHRIGRTGRAENPGNAITFVTEEDRHHFKVIQKKMKQKVALMDANELKL